MSPKDNPLLRTELSLSYLERDPLESGSSPAPVLVMFHGRGSNEEDLFDFAPSITPRFRVLSARAPTRLGLKAYRWFHTEYPVGQPILHDPGEADAALKLVLKFIGEVKAKYGVGAKDVTLLGFSQGAILSLAIALNHPKEVAGVIALSGRLLPEHVPEPPGPPGVKGFPVFLSHGTEDSVLPLALAHETRDVLTRLDVDFEYREYPMGHDVSEENQRDFIAWLETRMGQ